MHYQLIRAALLFCFAGVLAGVTAAALAGAGHLPLGVTGMVALVCGIGVLLVLAGMLLLRLAAVRHERELRDDLAASTLSFAPPPLGPMPAPRRQLRRAK